MSEPIFIRISDDDVEWRYDASFEEYLAVKTNPTAWFNANILGKGPACSNPYGNILYEGYQPGVGKRVELSGICGTQVIIANGFHEGLLVAFNAWHKKNMLLDVQLRSKKIPKEEVLAIANAQIQQQMRKPTPIDSPGEFWVDLDEKLVQYGYPNTQIVITVDEISKSANIHLELGSNQLLYFSMHGATVVDNAAFGKWVCNPQVKKIPRNVIFIDDKGVAADPVPLAPGSDIDSSDLSTPPIFNVSDPCGATQCYSACNVDTGYVNDYNPTTGEVNMNVEMILIKPYCVPNPSGNPCP